MLLFKTCLFITSRKTWDNSTRYNKPKIITATWNDELEWPYGSYSVSDIQDYVEWIAKKHETSTTISSILVCINRIKNKLVFKLKDRYKVRITNALNKKIIWQYKKNRNKTKNRENVPTFKLVEVVSVQINLVDNQYLNILIHILMSNKSYLYVLTVGPSYTVFLKTITLKLMNLS